MLGSRSASPKIKYRFGSGVKSACSISRYHDIRLAFDRDKIAFRMAGGQCADKKPLAAAKLHMQRPRRIGEPFTNAPFFRFRL